MSVPKETTMNLAKLDHAAEGLLKAIRASGFTGWSTLPLDQARAAILQMKSLAGAPESVGRVEDRHIHGADSAGLSARLYIPESCVPTPVMVYMHGGGWVLGDYTLVDSLARRLANQSNCAVLSVYYRLAPKHKFPCALDDVESALLWVRANASQWGLDGDRLAVGGDSSGANLAAAVALKFRDQGDPSLMFQLLVYPVLEYGYQSASYDRFGDGDLSLLSSADVKWFHHNYVNHPQELNLPYLCPLRAQSFTGLPPTCLICAEIDPLLDDAIAFAGHLMEAGVPVEMKTYAGMFHGFWRAGGVLSSANQAIDDAAFRMREALYPSST